MIYKVGLPNTRTAVSSRPSEVRAVTEMVSKITAHQPIERGLLGLGLPPIPEFRFIIQRHLRGPNLDGMVRVVVKKVLYVYDRLGEFGFEDNEQEYKVWVLFIIVIMDWD